MKDFEKKIIKMVHGIMPNGDSRLTEVYESDSELVELTNEHILFTMDEFSQEDLFRDNNPYNLGWNLAIGGISDILASGGEPVYYAHSMVAGRDWDEDFIRMFTHGLTDVLNKMGVIFIGGDFGRAQVWRYTAVVIGKPTDKTITRVGASEDDLIYFSGDVGLGNTEAALKLFESDPRLKAFSDKGENQFHLRYKESLVIKEFADTCIDTSDGVFHAVNTIAEINHLGFEIENLPYLELGLNLAESFSIPKEILFLGESGEYELLFTIKPAMEESFLTKANNMNLRFSKLGKLAKHNVKVLKEGDAELDLSQFGLRGRDFESVKEYLDAMVKFLKQGKA